MDKGNARFDLGLSTPRVALPLLAIALLVAPSSVAWAGPNCDKARELASQSCSSNPSTCPLMQSSATTICDTESTQDPDAQSSGSGDTRAREPNSDAEATSSAGGPQCPLGPRCQAAQDRAKPYLQDVASHLVGNGGMASESAAVAYCMADVGAEVNRVCGKEWQAEGLTQCASLAFQQESSLKQNRDQDKEASNALAGGNDGGVAAVCGYQ